MFRNSKQLPSAAIGAALVAAFLLGWLAGGSQCRSAQSSGPAGQSAFSLAEGSNIVSPAAYGKAFQLVIWVELKPGTALKWMQTWQVLAKYVKENEPCTLSYEAAVDETNPNRIVVFERYCSKADLTEVHQKSQPFATFKQQMNELDPYIRKEGAGLMETGIGHMVRYVPVRTFA